MPKLLLTIIVPTYNRAECLRVLLKALKEECAHLAEMVQVLVSDNASTDNTVEVIKTVEAGWSNLIFHRHPNNIGPDENFCSAIDRIDSRYFWIIGDDDCPKRGVLGAIVKILLEYSPSLLYMQSEWTSPIDGPDQGERIGAIEVAEMTNIKFARRVHIWTTFISGTIVNYDQLKEKVSKESMRRFSNLGLVQLGWVLPMVADGGVFLFVANRCVLARTENSGGYQIMTLFGANFARIVKDVMGSGTHISNTMIRQAIAHYLPGLFWKARYSPSGRHHSEDAWPAIRHELNQEPFFWAILWPLVRFPRLIANCFYQAWRVYHRLSSELEKFRDHTRANKRYAI